jgi:hypothetical protein
VGLFADGGVVYRHVSSGSALIAADNPDTSGIAFGGGVSRNLLLIRVSPEIRYTPCFTKPFGTDPYVENTTEQADFLLGITFQKASGRLLKRGPDFFLGIESAILLACRLSLRFSKLTCLRFRAKPISVSSVNGERNSFIF